MHIFICAKRKLEHWGQLFALDEHFYFCIIMLEEGMHLCLRYFLNSYNTINLSPQLIGMQGATICSLCYTSSS